MPETYKESQEREQKERQESRRRRGGELDEFLQKAELGIGGDSIQEIADKFSRIAIAVPEDLKPGDLGRQRRREALRVDLLAELAGDLGISLDELQDRLGQERGIDVNVDDNTQLLQFIASLLQSQNQLLGVVANTQVTQLENLIQIARHTSPGTLITVSGRNIIEDADTPEVVIPDSDKTDIPTQTLYIRADEQNTDPIAIGDDEVDPDDGFILKPGEFQVVPIDFRDEQLYMASETAGQAVRLLGVF